MAAAMDDIIERSREIDHKLDQDKVRLLELKDNLEKSDLLTHNMVTILDSFTSRLKSLDETIQPVYSQTLRLTRLQENVDKTLTTLDRVIGYHHVADEVEPRIREGPSGNIDGYLKLLERLRVALDFFHHSNPSSVELSHVTELFETGLDALQKDFLALLKRNSKPVPLAVLNDVATCEDMEDLPSLELLPVRTLLDLKAITEYLVQAPGENHTDIMSVYAQIRSNQLGRALNSLKEASQVSTLLPANMPKKSSFAASFLKGHGPSPARRGSLRPRSGQVPTSTSSSSHMLAEPAATTKHSFDDNLDGCASFLSSATVFLRLLQSEARLMQQIIPSQHQPHVLDSLARQPLEYFMREGETLFQQAKKCIARHDYTVVISCLRLVRHVQLLLPEYKAVLLGLPSRPFDRFPHLLQQFEKLCMKALQDDYIQYIRVDPDKQSNLSKDGTVHELTSSTLWFLENLLEYSRIVGEVFLGEGSFAARSSDLERRKALGHYLVRVFDALNINMENKARSYESPFLAAIFLLNNYHFMHKTFTRNDRMLQLMEDASSEIESKYSALVALQGRNYQRGFQKLMSFLGQELGMVTAGDKLGKQARQLLKDKFKGFNCELEELHRAQEQWSIPDPQLRGRVRGDNVEMILPFYSEFHRKYSRMNFTKNSEKYLKYTPEALEDSLRSFFNNGAS